MNSEFWHFQPLHKVEQFSSSIKFKYTKSIYILFVLPLDVKLINQLACHKVRLTSLVYVFEHWVHMNVTFTRLFFFCSTKLKTCPRKTHNVTDLNLKLANGTNLIFTLSISLTHSKMFLPSTTFSDIMEIKFTVRMFSLRVINKMSNYVTQVRRCCMMLKIIVF